MNKPERGQIWIEKNGKQPIVITWICHETEEIKYWCYKGGNFDDFIDRFIKEHDYCCDIKDAAQPKAVYRYAEEMKDLLRTAYYVCRNNCSNELTASKIKNLLAKLEDE